MSRDRELVKVMTRHFEGYASRVAMMLEDLLETERLEGGDASAEEAEVEKTLASVREALRAADGGRGAIQHREPLGSRARTPDSS